MTPLNQLLSHDPCAKTCFLSLAEREQGLLIQNSDAVSAISDFARVLKPDSAMKKE